jgi:hypothetical protein
VLKLESTGKGKERGIAGSSNLTMNQTLEGHQDGVVMRHKHTHTHTHTHTQNLFLSFLNSNSSIPDSLS